MAGTLRLILEFKSQATVIYLCMSDTNQAVRRNQYTERKPLTNVLSPVPLSLIVISLLYRSFHSPTCPPFHSCIHVIFQAINPLIHLSTYSFSKKPVINCVCKDHRDNNKSTGSCSEGSNQQKNCKANNLNIP